MMVYRRMVHATAAAFICFIEIMTVHEAFLFLS